MGARREGAERRGAAVDASVQAVPVVQAVPSGGLAPPWSVEVLIGLLLRSGVALSLALVLGGTLLSLFNHPEYFTSAEPLAGLVHPSSGPHSLEAVLLHVREVRGQAFVMLGLLVMVAVPVLRVGVAWAAFHQQRDRAFVRITTVVLALLLLSFLLGRAAE